MSQATRRVYRVIARVLPEEFRHTAGSGLEEAAVACVERERARLGSVGVATAWLHIVVDTIGAAVALRRDARPAFIPSSTDPNRLVGTQGVIEGLMDNFRKDVRYA